jgi:hypothetical protein
LTVQAERPRYVFHWLAPSRLERFSSAGALRPGWKHWIVGQGLVKGVCTAAEPMLWAPDDDLPGEAAVLVDLDLVEPPVHLLRSSLAYHGTKDIIRASRNGGDPAVAISRYEDAMAREARYDEVFVAGAIPWSSVAAIGAEGSRLTAFDATAFAGRHGLPLLDMDGWKVGNPGISEMHDILADIREQSPPSP